MAMDMHQQIADMQAAMRALWPDRPKVYFVSGQGDDAPVLTEEEQGQLRRVALAIADARKPVDTVRLPHDSFCEAESQPTCQCAERRLGATVDTAPESEVLEADDTVPVERLAHWLHGEFDTSVEDSDLLPWAQEREEIKDIYRRRARALMSQLPELFR